MHACFRRLHRVMLIVDGRRWACQVIDLVYFHIERERNVMPDHFEVLMVEQVLDIATRTGEEVIEADDDRSIGKQAFAKMRAEETSTARHQYSLLKVHLVTPLTRWVPLRARIGAPRTSDIRAPCAVQTQWNIVVLGALSAGSAYPWENKTRRNQGPWIVL